MPKQAQKSKIPPILVITGEDSFLVSKECERVLDAILPPDEREMGLSEPRADQADAAEVLDELRTLPFLASKRVVLIKDAQPFIKSYADKLEAYLDSPSPTGTLILDNTVLGQAIALHKRLQKISGSIIQVGKLYDNQLPAYVTGYASRTYQMQMDSQTCRLFIELVGDDPGRLCSEIDKLAVYIAPQKKATANDIEALIGQNRMYDAFGVIDAVSKSQTAQAVTRLRKMFESNKDSGYTIVGAFGFHFRRLFQAKVMISKGMTGSQAALKSGIRNKVWQNDFIRHLQSLSLEQLGKILAELGRIDFSLKTGKTTPPAAMERLIFKILQMQQPQRS